MIKQKTACALAVSLLVLGAAAHGQIAEVPSIRGTAQKKVASAWAKKLNQRLLEVSKTSDGNLGVAVVDIQTGESAGHQDNRRWYLASAVKVPVAIEVLRQIEQKKLNWDQEITFQLSMAVDGAGGTNNSEPGQKRSVRFLVEEMMIDSDNTATDILIGLVGIDNINAMLDKWMPRSFGPVTSLLDVRRHAYAEIHPDARKLTGMQFIEIRKRESPADRYKYFTELVKAKPKELKQLDIDRAFEVYYGRGYNTGTLIGFAKLLALAAEEKLVSPFVSKELLSLMSRCKTGSGRLKKTFPKGTKFAHKTGSQLHRICDVGVLDVAPKKVAIAACVEKFKEQAEAEKALARVGAVIFAETSAPK